MLSNVAYKKNLCDLLVLMLIRLQFRIIIFVLTLILTIFVAKRAIEVALIHAKEVLNFYKILRICMGYFEMGSVGYIKHFNL
jgi:hypothetical protein